MAATTIKLEAGLGRKVMRLKLRRESISDYVRGLIEKEYRQWASREAARKYQQFLRDTPEERVAMETWESAR